MNISSRCFLLLLQRPKGVWGWGDPVPFPKPLGLFCLKFKFTYTLLEPNNLLRKVVYILPKEKSALFMWLYEQLFPSCFNKTLLYTYYKIWILTFPRLKFLWNKYSQLVIKLTTILDVKTKAPASPHQC